MHLFYVTTVLILSAGFIAGYKTGFAKLLMGILTTAVAAGSSCCCFVLLQPQLNNWLNFSWDVNASLIFCTIFLIILCAFVLVVKFLRLRIYADKPKRISRFLGAVTGMALCAGALIIVLTVSDVFKTPALVTDKLEASGITAFVNTSSTFIKTNLPVYEEESQEIILAADNNIKTAAAEKTSRLPQLRNTFIVRPDLETEMLQLLNKERNLAGLPFLIADTSLIFVARNHSADMCIRGYFSHNTPEGLTPFNRLQTAKISYLYAGENLAFATTIIKAHKGLMLSAGHRANILNKNYRKAGIGVLENPLHGLIITQEFKD